MQWFPYIGKSMSSSGDLTVTTDIGIKLMTALFKNGHNVTTDNYFTFLHLCLRLAKQGRQPCR